MAKVTSRVYSGGGVIVYISYFFPLFISPLFIPLNASQARVGLCIAFVFHYYYNFGRCGTVRYTQDGAEHIIFMNISRRLLSFFYLLLRSLWFALGFGGLGKAGTTRDFLVTGSHHATLFLNAGRLLRTVI